MEREMKKNLWKLAVLPIAFMLIGASSTKSCSLDFVCGEGLSTPLVDNNGQHVGWLEIANNDNALYATVIAYEDWQFAHVALEVAESPDAIPNYEGRLLFGHFGHSERLIEQSYMHTWTVPLDGIEPGVFLYIASHVALVADGQETNVPVQAWADGELLWPNTDPSWGTFLEYKVQSCNPEEDLAGTNPHL
jgi:hypothetical protein